MRNWKWFVAVVCVGLGASVTSLVALLLWAMRSSDAYGGAVARAAGDPTVIAALGEPIKAGYWFTGNIAVSGSSGQADFAIPISGPRGKASVYVVATKSAGIWHFDQLVVQLEPNGSRIDLSDGAGETPLQPAKPTVAKGGGLALSERGTTVH
jgi:Cytochrome oxidase complex assembly protein 1